MVKLNKKHVDDSKPSTSLSTSNNLEYFYNEKAISVNKNKQILLRIRAKPGAKKSLITDVGETEIGVALAAQAREGQANAELLESMTEWLELKKSEIEFDKGAKSRSKILIVTTERFDVENIREKLLKFVKNK